MQPRRETKSFPIAHVKAVDVDAGTFEAFVAVFGNVDLHGDRIAPDAFNASLERWKASGDPVPIIFSHQWHDLTAYLGEADPADIEAVPAGDPRLPEAIADLGGLLVKGRIDVDEPEGRKALKLLKRRAVREFSFAYDILDEVRGADGFTELTELDLIEAGPTLKGANPLTQLVAAKAASNPAIAEALDVLRKAIADEDGEAELEDPPAKTAGPRAKAWVTPSGTIERQLEALRTELLAAAVDRYAENLYALAIEGTWADRVLFYVELWDEPYGGGTYFEASYTAAGEDADGDAPTVGEWAAVDFEVEIVPRTGTASVGDRYGRKEGRRNASSDLGRIQSVHDLAAELGASCSDPDGTTDEDPDDESDAGTLDTKTVTGSSSPALLLATVETELLDL